MKTIAIQGFVSLLITMITATFLTGCGLMDATVSDSGGDSSSSLAVETPTPPPALPTLDPEPEITKDIIFDGGNMVTLNGASDLTKVVVSGACVESTKELFFKGALNARVPCTDKRFTAEFNFTTTETPVSDMDYPFYVYNKAGRMVDMLTFRVDRLPPVITVSSSEAEPTPSNPITFMVVASEDIILLSTMVQITGGVLESLIGAGRVFIVKVTPFDEGVVGVSIPGGIAMDIAGNMSGPSNILTRKPQDILVVSITSTEPQLTSQASIPIKAKFSRAITGFDLGDFTNTYSTVANIQSVSSLEYTFDLIPDPGRQGSMTVFISANGVTDSKLRGNQASNMMAFFHDTIGPSITLSTTAISPTNNSSLIVKLVSPEVLLGLTADDIQVVGGTVTNLSTCSIQAEGFVCQVTIDLSANATVTTVQVNVNANAATDEALNTSLASNTLSISYDPVRPTVILSSSYPENPLFTSVFYSAFFRMNLVFSEPVTGLSLASLSVNQGELLNLTGSGTTYTVEVLAHQAGVISVTLADGGCKDLAQNNCQTNVFTRTILDNPSPYFASASVVPSDGSAELSLTFMGQSHSGTPLAGTEFVEVIASTDDASLTLNGAGACGLTRVGMKCIRATHLANGIFQITATKNTAGTVRFMVYIPVTNPSFLPLGTVDGVILGKQISINFDSGQFEWIQSGAVLVTGAPSGKNIYVSGTGTADFDASTENASFGDIFVNGGVVRHIATTHSEIHKLKFTAASLTLQNNGRIDASGLGFIKGDTIGSTLPSSATSLASQNLAGGSHGGKGSREDAGASTPGVTYGDPKMPDAPGGGPGASCAGGKGGGLVHLNINGQCRFNSGGTIRANGINEGTSCGGAGGGIYLSCGGYQGSLSSTIIQANGAAGTSAGGSGGGGRVALTSTNPSSYWLNDFRYFNTSADLTQFSSHIEALGGSSTYPAAAGTIFLKPSDLTHGDLIVRNYSSQTYTPARMASVTTGLPALSGTINSVTGNTMTVTVTEGLINPTDFTDFYKGLRLRPDLSATNGTPTNWSDDAILQVASNTGVALATTTTPPTLPANSNFRSLYLFNHLDVSNLSVLETLADVYVVSTWGSTQGSVITDSFFAVDYDRLGGILNFNNVTPPATAHFELPHLRQKFNNLTLPTGRNFAFNSVNVQGTLILNGATFVTTQGSNVGVDLNIQSGTYSLPGVQVGQDLALSSGSLTLTQSSTVTRDLLFSGGSLTANAPLGVTRDFTKGTSAGTSTFLDTLTIGRHWVQTTGSTTHSGAVTVTGNLTLSSGTNLFNQTVSVGGNLTQNTSATQSTFQQNVAITGDLTQSVGTLNLNQNLTTVRDLLLSNSTFNSLNALTPRHLSLTNMNFNINSQPLHTTGNLTLVSGSYTFNSDHNLTVDGNLTLNAGSFTLSDTPSVIPTFLVGQDLVVTGGTLTVPDTTLLKPGRDFIVSGGTLTALQTQVVNDFNISGGTLTTDSIVVGHDWLMSGTALVKHNPTTTTTIKKLTVTVANNLNFTGGKIDATGLGFPVGYSFGWSGSTQVPSNHANVISANGAGGSHGGNASKKNDGTGDAGPAYDDYRDPQFPGAGGSSCASGGQGGGIVRINVTKNCALTGTAQIRANGALCGTSGAGGGAGGSVYLKCESFDGLSSQGAVQANGGDPFDSAGSGGGGGRIALISTGDSTVWKDAGVPIYPTDAGTDDDKKTRVNNFRAYVDAAGGAYSAIYPAGGAGTIYLRHSSSDPTYYGDILIDNYHTDYDAPITQVFNGSASAKSGGTVLISFEGSINTVDDPNKTLSVTLTKGNSLATGGISNLYKGVRLRTNINETPVPADWLAYAKMYVDTNNDGTGGLTITSASVFESPNPAATDTFRSLDVFDHLDVSGGAVLRTNGDLFVKSSWGDPQGSSSHSGMIDVLPQYIGGNMLNFDNLIWAGGDLYYPNSDYTFQNLTISNGSITGHNLSVANQLTISGGTLDFLSTTTQNSNISGGTLVSETVTATGDWVQSGGTITHHPTTTAEVKSLVVTVNGNFTMTGGDFDVSGRGYLAGYSYGVGAPSNSPTVISQNGAGGSHGGLGSKQASGTGTVGSFYDSIRFPQLPGGGYATCVDTNLTTNGAGGGVIKLLVTDPGVTGKGQCSFTGTSSLKANGVACADTNAGAPVDAGGGGAGGSIFVKCRTIDGTMENNAIQAKGGSATGVGFGSGGGGRVSLISIDDSWGTNFAHTLQTEMITMKAQVSVAGGQKTLVANQPTGGSGTFFFANSETAAGNLVIDNKGNAALLNSGFTVLAAYNGQMTSGQGTNNLSVTPNLPAVQSDFISGLFVRADVNPGDPNYESVGNWFLRPAGEHRTITALTTNSLTLDQNADAYFNDNDNIRTIDAFYRLDVSGNGVLQSQGDLYTGGFWCSDISAVPPFKTSGTCEQAGLLVFDMPQRADGTLDLNSKTLLSGEFRLPTLNFGFTTLTIGGSGILEGNTLTSNDFTLSGGELKMNSLSITNDLNLGGGTLTLTNKDVSVTRKTLVTGGNFTLTTLTTGATGDFEITGGTFTTDRWVIGRDLIVNGGNLFLQGAALNSSIARDWLVNNGNTTVNNDTTKQVSVGRHWVQSNGNVRFQQILDVTGNWTLSGGIAAFTALNATIPEINVHGNWAMSAGNLLMEKAHIYGTADLTGGILRHPPTTSTYIKKFDLTVDGNLTLSGTTQIDVSGLGYPNLYSYPLNTYVSNFYTSQDRVGATHGGMGAKGTSYSGYYTGKPYGDYRNPNWPGGGATRSVSTDTGCATTTASSYPSNLTSKGAGGGVVRIQSGGECTFAENTGSSPQILANGAANCSYGSPAGGSIYMQCSSFNRTGSTATPVLSANGGTTLDVVNGGSGGGGRIALITTGANNTTDWKNGFTFDLNALSSQITAYGGGTTNPGGGAGTIFFKHSGHSATSGALLVNNGKSDVWVSNSGKTLLPSINGTVNNSSALPTLQVNLSGPTSGDFDSTVSNNVYSGMIIRYPAYDNGTDVNWGDDLMSLVDGNTFVAAGSKRNLTLNAVPVPAPAAADVVRTLHQFNQLIVKGTSLLETYGDIYIDGADFNVNDANSKVTAYGINVNDVNLSSGELAYTDLSIRNNLILGAGGKLSATSSTPTISVEKKATMTGGTYKFYELITRSATEGDFELQAGTLMVEKLTIGRHFVQTGGWLMHPPSASGVMKRLEITTGGYFQLVGPGKIDVSGLGYPSGTTWAPNGYYDSNLTDSDGTLSYPIGASHGGEGSGTSSGSNLKKTIYGRYDAPDFPGAGCENDTQACNSPVGIPTPLPTPTAGAGGGAVKVIAVGTCQFDKNGTDQPILHAKGMGGNSSNQGVAAGGSVFLTCGTFSGNADGTEIINVAGGTNIGASAGQGGGGRIALVATGDATAWSLVPTSPTNTFYALDTTVLSRLTAIGGGALTSSYRGGAGTIFIKNYGLPYGNLYIRNQGTLAYDSSSGRTILPSISGQVDSHFDGNAWDLKVITPNSSSLPSVFKTNSSSDHVFIGHSVRNISNDNGTPNDWFDDPTFTITSQTFYSYSSETGVVSIRLKDDTHIGALPVNHYFRTLYKLDNIEVLGHSSLNSLADIYLNHNGSSNFDFTVDAKSTISLARVKLRDSVTFPANSGSYTLSSINAAGNFILDGGTIIIGNSSTNVVGGTFSQTAGSLRSGYESSFSIGSHSTITGGTLSLGYFVGPETDNLPNPAPNGSTVSIGGNYSHSGGTATYRLKNRSMTMGGNYTISGGADNFTVGTGSSVSITGLFAMNGGTTIFDQVPSVGGAFSMTGGAVTFNAGFSIGSTINLASGNPTLTSGGNSSVNGDIILDSGSMTFNSNLTLTGGLSVATTTSIVTNGNLTISGGSLTTAASSTMVTKGNLTVSGALTTAANSTFEAWQTLNVGTNLTIGGTATLHTVNVTNQCLFDNGSSITHRPGSSPLNISAGTFKLLGTSSIDVSGKGYQNSSSHIYSSLSASSASAGGSYGGAGGGTGTSVVTYGNYKAPIYFGGGTSTCATGGEGGGAIHVTTNTGNCELSNTASLKANGTNCTAILSSSPVPSAASGGAGGSIYLDCKTGFSDPNNTGYPLIQANGGSGIATGGGGGGGGRIALVSRSADSWANNISYPTSSAAFQGLTSTVQAYGGAGSTPTYTGGAGTIFFQNSTRTNGDLMVANNGQAGGTTTLPSFSAYVAATIAPTPTPITKAVTLPSSFSGGPSTGSCLVNYFANSGATNMKVVGLSENTTPEDWNQSGKFNYTITSDHPDIDGGAGCTSARILYLDAEPRKDHNNSSSALLPYGTVLRSLHTIDRYEVFGGGVFKTYGDLEITEPPNEIYGPLTGGDLRLNQSTTLYSGTFDFTNIYAFGNLTVGSNSASTASTITAAKLWVKGNLILNRGTLTHLATYITLTPTLTFQVHSLDITVKESSPGVDGNITLTPTTVDGASIDVSGKGYPAKYSYGVVLDGSSNSTGVLIPKVDLASILGAGGSHGGIGSKSSATSGTPGDPYDFFKYPTLPGGGGSATAACDSNTSAGGGVVKIHADRACTINTTNISGTDYTGKILANGQDGGACGGGAGGSVNVTCESFAGTMIDGALQANGGKGAATYGHGGGGRIALIATGANGASDFAGNFNYTGDLANFKNRVQARGAAATTATTETVVGGAGTIFLKHNGLSQGDLIIHNARTATRDTTLGGVTKLVSSRYGANKFDRGNPAPTPPTVPAFTDAFIKVLIVTDPKMDYKQDLYTNYEVFVFPPDGNFYDVRGATLKTITGNGIENMGLSPGVEYRLDQVEDGGTNDVEYYIMYRLNHIEVSGYSWVEFDNAGIDLVGGCDLHSGNPLTFDITTGSNIKDVWRLSSSYCTSKTGNYNGGQIYFAP